MKNIFAALTTFFRWIGKFLSTTRSILGNLLFLLFIVVIFTTFLFEKKPPVIKDAALILSLAGNIVEEKQSRDPITELLSELTQSKETTSETLLQDVLDAIHHAATDSQIKCILLDLNDLGTVGLDQMQTIGESLNEFKKSGKKVIAAEDYYRQKAYYLASFASEIYLNPMGGVDLHGLGSYPLFFREALEKLQINYHVFRVGTYKSAVEPILRDSMSEEAKEQMRGLLTSLWSIFTTDITRQRSLPADAIDQYTNNITTKLAASGGSTAQLAMENKLVDGLKTREELRNYLGKQTAAAPDHGFSQISLNNYLRTITPSYEPPLITPDNTIGVIIAEGMILDGKQPMGTIGGDTLAASLRKARLDPKVKAVALRINSGGGSAFASEIIRQEILELKKSAKPLVVSMGSTAASGGYWIAANADEIWASTATITGSIGIFAAFPTFENSLASLGIHSDGFGTTPLASGLNLSRPLSPPLEVAVQMTLEHGYQQFLSLVAKGRRMDMEKVQTVAGGRVFHGKEAQQLGLVDKIGTLEDAIKSAAQMAKIENYSAIYIEKPRSFLDEIRGIFNGQVVTTLLRQTMSRPLVQQIAQLTAPFRELLLFNDPAGLYAHSLIQGPSILEP
ncbi:MAG: signal peptide peptidase SppA [Proteobacteria bacterium]|jgi:protease-4|nr:signal peptide peptidase SppA [Desulfocapsa sp.]MBU3944830.1 signal peptide peptidase SppA [Pseudomonadota bacterium]MCG2745679.1 signal peptide peptidase SppA [Desulfobacteraceae bacterium]MBU3983039.1 signal peptide peptidase SppA [Pseudomonadota bacterium]MBU4029429.1 signal peptide peptidase SppA [Pseudomonadota bacterium]